VDASGGCAEPAPLLGGEEMQAPRGKMQNSREVKPALLGLQEAPPQASSMLDGSIASHASSTKPTVAPDKRSKVPRTLE
jgi:hypothetical protein